MLTAMESLPLAGSIPTIYLLIPSIDSGESSQQQPSRGDFTSGLGAGRVPNSSKNSKLFSSSVMLNSPSSNSWSRIEIPFSEANSISASRPLDSSQPNAFTQTSKSLVTKKLRHSSFQNSKSLGISSNSHSV